jgi:hypothetical protein
MGKKAFRLGWIALIAMLVIVVFVPVQVQAGIKPCCEGGLHPGKFCTVETDCPDACTGGAHDGQNCASGGCPNACVGGKKHGDACVDNSGCPGICVQNNDSCFVDADCTFPGGAPSGPCVDVGSCSNIGSCGNPGSCSGTCLSKGKGPKGSPGDPVKAGDLGDADTKVEPLACFETAR